MDGKWRWIKIIGGGGGGGGGGEPQGEGGKQGSGEGSRGEGGAMPGGWVVRGLINHPMKSAGCAVVSVNSNHLVRCKLEQAVKLTFFPNYPT